MYCTQAVCSVVSVLLPNKDSIAFSIRSVTSNKTSLLAADLMREIISGKCFL
jgi:hypothetical protein